MVLFCFWRCAEKPILTVLFKYQPKVAQKGPPTNDKFSQFAKHRLQKKHFVATPSWHQKLVFLNLSSLKHKDIGVEQKHNPKLGKSKDKEKGLERQNKTENQKQKGLIKMF